MNYLLNFTDWRALGLNLGLTPGQLGEVKVNHSLARDRDHALLEWLRMMHSRDKHGRPTWTNLADALEQIDRALSIIIRKKHCTAIPL